MEQVSFFWGSSRMFPLFTFKAVPAWLHQSRGLSYWSQYHQIVSNPRFCLWRKSEDDPREEQLIILCVREFSISVLSSLHILSLLTHTVTREASSVTVMKPLTHEVNKILLVSGICPSHTAGTWHNRVGPRKSSSRVCPLHHKRIKRSTMHRSYLHGENKSHLCGTLTGTIYYFILNQVSRIWVIAGFTEYVKCQ